MRIALSLSETEDINSDRDQQISKQKRRLLAANKSKHKITIDKKKQTSKITSSSIPPLPKHSFNLSGKIIKHQFILKLFIYYILLCLGHESPCKSPSKNSICIDQNVLDDLNCTYHEPSNPVI